jgi:CRP/FNR family cyclic AMP-dependent transcriptional regulator
MITTGDSPVSAIRGPYHRNTFLAALSREELASLLRPARLVSFEVGQVMLRQGRLDDQLLVLHQGSARSVADIGDGRDMLLGLSRPGDLVGEVRYLLGGPRTASVVAATPVVAFALDFAAFGAVLRQHPRMMAEVARSVARRLGWADRRRLYSRLPVLVRVARLLHELALTVVQGHGPGRPLADAEGVVVPVTQRELGQLVGASEVAVQKSLRELSRRGCLRRQYGRVTWLADPAEVRRPGDGREER